MSAVLTIAFPVFSIILAGLFAGRVNLLKPEDAQALNRFVFFFAMPAALFGLTARAEPPSKDDALMALCYLGAALIVMASAYWLGRKTFSLSEQEAGAHAFTSTLGNAVFLGLPIVLSLEGWTEHYVMLMLMEGTVIIAIAAALISPREDKDKTRLISRLTAPLLRSLRNPLVAAMLAGIAVAMMRTATGFEPPRPIVSFFDLLGRAGGPTALFSMGLFLATHKLPPLADVAGKVGAVFAFKMIALPVLTLAGISFLGVTDPAMLGSAALFVLVPSGIGSYVMASQYGVYTAETAAAIAVTTLASVFTVSAVLAVYAG